jgi:hypothetical protein
MSLQFGTTLRNNMLDQVESTAGTAALFRIYSGSAPANCGTAASGTLLVEMSLPSDWMAAAASGAKSMSGTWEDTSANATGTAGYFRIYDSAGTTCHVQGTVTATGGGGDVTLDNTSIASAQDVKITSFTLTAPGA